MNRGLKFRLYEVEILHYLFSKNKEAAADLRLCFGIMQKQVLSFNPYQIKDIQLSFLKEEYSNTTNYNLISFPDM